jgi:hypothetical protein
MPENLPALPPPFFNSSDRRLYMELDLQSFIGEVKVSTDIDHFPPGTQVTQPMPCISVALMAQYMNVRQRKFGTIIFQTVHTYPTA